MGVVGLGDPVMDHIYSVSDALLRELELAPGGCLPVTEVDMSSLVNRLQHCSEGFVERFVPILNGSVKTSTNGFSVPSPFTTSHRPANSQCCPRSAVVARIPGGSCANVTKGLAMLSDGALRVRFVGMIGADASGAEYREKLAAEDVEPMLLESTSGSTASCLCLVNCSTFSTTPAPQVSAAAG
jgi:sugar/nucleoside kinase (ribokinase family)